MANRRRLLLLSYYFPPSGGPGVQRALKFATYLAGHNWIPTVLTVRPDRAAFPEVDPSLVDEVPHNLPVERTRAWDPYRLYARFQGKSKDEVVGVSFTGEGEATSFQRFARWIRGNIFLPDARVGWLPFAISRGEKLLRSNSYDAIFSTGPPHSVHLAACWLKWHFSLPWIADFRDRWTGTDFYSELPMSGLATSIDAFLEETVLSRADITVTVTEKWRRHLSARGAGRCELIRNGFDPAHFAGEQPPLKSNFSIEYLGSLNRDRNPQVLWQAMQKLDAARRPEVRLTGSIDPVAEREVEERGLGDDVRLEAHISHDRAISRMQSAPLLLLSINRVEGADGIVPGKLYEYIATGRPILGIGPPDGEAAQIIREADAGAMFGYDDIDGVRRFLADHRDAWDAGQPKQGASAEAASTYSRKRQTGQLAALLDELVDGQSEGLA